MPSTALNQPMDLSTAAEVICNPSVDQLISDCLELDHCRLASNGAVVAYTGQFTGRVPKDKRTVRDAETEDHVWWGNNIAMTPEEFASVRSDLQTYVAGKRLYVIDTFAGADPKYRIAARFIVERPYHALFIYQLLLRPTREQLAVYEPDWTVVDLGRHRLDPTKSPTHESAIVALNMTDRQVLIAGTEYAGEMKKSVFTIMNYLLPLRGVLGMHCSANVGPEGDTALFFGLSGTGKTTLSADPERELIGDDEHGWSDEGVFNVEGGCYAKCINLSESGEPQIWSAIRRGSVLENVVLADDGTPRYDDASLTENTRAAYPIEYMEGARIPSMGGHPKNIVFLTADANGLLPPLAKLDRDQTRDYFLNGYTAKLAGTEAGVKEPQVAFSTCFAAPFLPLPPATYALMLCDKIDEYGIHVWLVNTGWSGGPYGTGSRIQLAYTRAMLRAAFDGDLDDVEFEVDPAFGLRIPVTCPGVPSEILNPRATWADKAAYDMKARELNRLFQENSAKYR